MFGKLGGLRGSGEVDDEPRVVVLEHAPQLGVMNWWVYFTWQRDYHGSRVQVWDASWRRICGCWLEETCHVGQQQKSEVVACIVKPQNTHSYGQQY